MRILITAAALALTSSALLAQTGQTGAIVPSKSPPMPKGPGAVTSGTPLQNAQSRLHAIRAKCKLLENDNKLFAVCDNTTAAAKVKGSNEYLPQNPEEWKSFTSYIWSAYSTVKQAGHPVTVINGDDIVAETDVAGNVTLKLK
jgi:hypothetical protein